MCLWGPNLTLNPFRGPAFSLRMAASTTAIPAGPRNNNKKKQPIPLFESAAAVVVDQSLLLPVEDTGLPGQAVRAAQVATLLEDLPTSIANYLTWMYVNRYVDRRGQGQCGASGASDALEAGEAAVGEVQALTAPSDSDPLFLVDILGRSVSALDLSPLVRLGRREHADLLAFNERFLSALPRLGGLAKLTLSTHGKSFTLPACSDYVLEEIAKQCPQLVSLDVSHNTGVSATGLTQLCAGCPLLEELFVYDCVIPTAVLAGVLAGLPRLRLLGHQELGAAVVRLHRQGHDVPLRLTHVANLGETTLHKSATEPHRLRCRLPMVRALRQLCPDLENLKIRTLDEDVRHLGALRGVSALELRFHAAARISSLSEHTVKYLRAHGARLTALTVYSHSLQARHVTLIGECCPNMRILWLRSNLMVWTTEEERRGRLFTRLESLSLRVGNSERAVTSFPAAFMQSLVRDATQLRQLYLAVNSDDLTDQWLRQVLESFDASSLRALYLLLPNVNRVPFALRLTLASVELVRSLCPDLETLGNLLVWSLQPEEVRFLQQQLRDTNSALSLVSKETIWR